MKADRSREVAPYDELGEDDVIALQVENEKLRRVVARLAPDGFSRYVVLCDDGSVITTDELMDGDDVLVDRGES